MLSPDAKEWMRDWIGLDLNRWGLDRSDRLKDARKITFGQCSKPIHRQSWNQGQGAFLEEACPIIRQSSTLKCIEFHCYKKHLSESLLSKLFDPTEEYQCPLDSIKFSKNGICRSKTSQSYSTIFGVTSFYTVVN